MALSIVILLFAAVLLFGFALRSRYGLPLFLMTFGMCVLSAAVLLQSYNSSMYMPPGYLPFRALDLRLYRYIGGFRVPAARAQGIRLAGCLLFFGGVLAMLALVGRNLKESRRHRRTAVLFCAGSALFMALFTLFYSPQTAYALYLRYYALPEAARAALRTWISRADLFMRGCVLVYIALPPALLTVNYLRRNTTYFADSFILLMGILLLFDAICYTVFFTGSFALSPDAAFRSGFWYFSNVSRVPVSITLIVFVFSILIPIFIVGAANHIFNGELVLLSRKRAVKNSIEELNRNMKDVFHSEKNLMFSILILANEAREAYGAPEGLEKLDQLSKLAKGRMETIASSLNRIRELHLHPAPVDMRKLVDQALSELPLPEGVRCEKHYCGFPVRCLIDEYHTGSALKNLIQNAAEALALSDREDKAIAVFLDASKAWVSLSIRDNGPGIPRQELRHVMLPFVSSKSKNSNWGIGLPYAFRVINAQMGQMRIHSSEQPGRQFTEVDILLPRERRTAP